LLNLLKIKSNIKSSNFKSKQYPPSSY